jgi:hypothetical protein
MVFLGIVITPVPANATDASPLVPFLMLSGDMGGFGPGKAQIFPTVAEVKSAAGERPAKREIRRYEAEGFIEAALVRIHRRAEPAARGISSVFEFETPTGAEAEMKAELKEELDPEALREEGILRYLTLRHFKVPGVPQVVAFAFLPRKSADRLGVESGIAKALLVEGNCLLTVGVFSQASNEVIEPVVSGVQAIFERADGSCP